MPDFTFPDSVHAYLTERGIGAAVDALTGRTLERTPPVGWDELPAYYDATLAALQVQVDWAKAGAALWEATWQPVLDGWTPLDLGDQARQGWGSNSIRRCWDDDRFVRVSSRGDRHLFTYVSFDAGNCHVGVAAATRSGRTWIDHGFEQEEGWNAADEILWSPDGAVPFDRVIDVAALQAQARVLLGIAGPAFTTPR